MTFEWNYAEGKNLFSLDECTPTIVLGVDGARRFALECEHRGVRFAMLLDGFDLAEFGGMLLGTLDELARLDGLENPLPRVRRKRAETAARLIRVEILHCSKCPKPTAVIDGGVRYCKRHAREAGIVTHGKII